MSVSAVCFCLPFSCACFFAKAEISWLGTIRGDSECRAVLFLFVSDIRALEHTSLYASVCSCVFELSPKAFCQTFLFSFQCISKHGGAYSVKLSDLFLFAYGSEKLSASIQHLTQAS